MQCLQNAPQVPAQTIIQTFPGDGQWIQQLLQAVVSAKNKKKEKKNLVLPDGCIKSVRIKG